MELDTSVFGTYS